MSEPQIRPDALADIVVVDFTIVMSGPMCTRMLADAGADVVKVEPPDGDVVRQRPPQRGGVSTYYASMNCGKRASSSTCRPTTASASPASWPRRPMSSSRTSAPG